MKRMKMYMTTMAICSAFIMTAQTSVYLTSGIHSANVNMTGVSADFLDIRSINRFTGGVIVDHALDNYLSVRSGLIYQVRGFQVAESIGIDIANMPIPVGLKVTTEVNTITTPLMLQYNIRGLGSIKPYVAAGPGISYAASGAVRTKATAILDFTIANTPLNLSSDDYKRIGIDGNIVAGIKFPYGNGEFLTEISYNLAMTDFTSDNFIVDAGIRPKGVSFAVGYGIRF